MKKNSHYPGFDRGYLTKLLFLMKISFFLITFCTLTISASVFPQAKKLTIDKKNATIREILDEVEKQAGFKFFYIDEQIDVTRKTSVALIDKPVEDLLEQVFNKDQVKYKVFDNNLVVLTPNNTSENSQQIKVTGTITDVQSGESLAGVNIFVEGTTIGVISDIDGKYSIDLPNANSVLVFSYIGYLTEKLPYAGQNVMDVKMNPDVKSLEEVVVVGYGTQKKSDVTGAVISVSNKEIISRPVNNIFEAMQGKAAGVDITTSLRPGEKGEISIRGTRSITATSEPLYVVDGIPAGGIETLNPADIESIDILKDASATAIYGSRGANGVIMVTTKRAISGKLTLNYSGSVTSTSMIWRSQYMNVGEYIDFVRWGSYNVNSGGFSPGDQPSLVNDGNIALFKADPTAWNNIQKGWASGTWDPSKIETFDWIGNVTQSNLTQEHTISGSGGTNTMKAYASLGYLNNQGTTKGQEYQRYTLRSNVELNPKDWIQFGANLNASWEYQDYGQSNIGGTITPSTTLIGSAAKIYPYALPYDADGNLIQYPGGQTRVASTLNEWEYSTNQRETLRLMGNLFGEVKIPFIKGLKYRMNFGPDFRSYRNGIYNDGKSVTRGGSSYASYGGNSQYSWTLDNLLYYDKLFGNHKIGLTLLQTASKGHQEFYNMNAQGIAIASQEWYAMGSVSALQGWNTDLTENQLVSYMGRLNYNFSDKYLLTTSGRWDGASQLADNHKWAFFPSVALGWRMDQEDFLKDVDWINQMKVRLGYGVTGNSAVKPYNTKAGINSVQTPFGTSVIIGYSPKDTFPDQELGWERTTQYNLGLDFSLFKGRISGVVDLYTSNTTDLILTVLLPSVSGYKAMVTNVGETKNRGIDITLNTINVKTNNFTWDSRVSAAWQNDEIVLLMNGPEDMVGSNSNGGWFIGESISSSYTYERLGLWQDTPEDQAEMALFNANGHRFQPGMVKVRDMDGDHRITSNKDMKVIGNLRPRWTIGMNNTFTYKNLQLSVFITGRLKYIANVGESLTGMYGDQRVLDYWTPNNTDAEYQKPFRDEAGGDTYSGTYFKDDSYIKIRSISLGYEFPKAILSRLKINNLRLSVQSTNPGMLWSNNKFRDAEYNTLYYNRGFVFKADIGF